MGTIVFDMVGDDFLALICAVFLFAVLGLGRKAFHTWFGRVSRGG